jgi:DNA polymerase-3 subunit delta
MDASAKKILNDLKAGKYAPVYLLQGEEPFYIDLISNYIENNTLSESERSFNQVVLYGKDAPVSVILNNARRFPMMAERQVVIVREAQDIPDLLREPGVKLMLDYLAKPVPFTVLVLCHKHKPIDKRKDAGKKIEQMTMCATFKKPADYQLGEFVLEYVNGKGYGIDERGVRVLTEYVGNDLSRLANEVDKLLISTPQGETVKAEKVMAQVGISRQYNIFELQKALVKKDALLAAKIVQYMEGNTKKNPVIPMVAFLYSFFSKLLAASTAPDKSERGLVSLLKMNPYAAKDYAIALQHYSTEKLIESIGLLKQSDLKLKGVNSGEVSESQVLKELVFRLLH